MIDTLTRLRKELHKFPERSGEEQRTAERIIEFIKDFHPTEIIKHIGGAGVAVVYEFADKGPTVVIRCELDALPIVEENDFAHQSENMGVSHKCGHDGHMAIVAGLAIWLAKSTIKKGKVVLLFQPAEENGKGAPLVLADTNFLNLKPDYVFAIHNLPGHKSHTIVIKPGCFTATVHSACIQLKGRKAHASEPENGMNPTLAAAELIQQLSTFSNPNHEQSDFALVTPICIAIGDKNYGISPENAELYYTIRTWSNLEMKVLQEKIKVTVEIIAQRNGLRNNMDWFEFFPASNNNKECVAMIEKIANQEGFDVKKLNTPLRFGEDFGWYSASYKSAIFGLGAGEDQPALHHSDYDFPDELIETGIRMFQGLIIEILSE